MTPRLSHPRYIEEHFDGDYRQMGIYAPLVWLAAMVMRLGIRTAGFFSPELFLPARPEIAPVIMHRNRQLRRARISCLRRAHRALLKHGKINKEDYTPKAYAHYAYIGRMDKTISPAQFRERYIRDNNLSRVQVYALDSAHEITGFTAGISETLLGLFSNIAGAMSVSPLSLAAPCDPAPP